MLRRPIQPEPLALSPDTKKMLTDMGYKITEQPAWGAAAGIVVMPAATAPPGQPPTNGTRKWNRGCG